jgi:hypothetical protein
VLTTNHDPHTLANKEGKLTTFGKLSVFDFPNGQKARNGGRISNVRRVKSRSEKRRENKMSKISSWLSTRKYASIRLSLHARRNFDLVAIW